MNGRFAAGAGAAVLVGLATAGAGLAGEPTERIKAGIDQVLSIVRDASLKEPARAAERRARIRAVTDQHFDWHEMGRQVLSRHWKDRTPDEQRQFVDLFRDLVEQTYLREIERYTDETIRYEGDTVEGDFAVVKMTLVTKSNVEVPVVYRLLKAKGAGPTPAATRPASPWRIHDFTVEGVSLVNNYRTQVRDLMGRAGFSEVVRKLRQKIAEGAGPPPAASQPAGTR